MKLRESAESFWKHLQVTTVLYPNTHTISKMMMRTTLLNCNMQMRYIEDNFSKTFDMMNIIIRKSFAHHTKKDFLKSHNWIVWTSLGAFTLVCIMITLLGYLRLLRYYYWDKWISQYDCGDIFITIMLPLYRYWDNMWILIWLWYTNS